MSLESHQPLRGTDRPTSAILADIDGKVSRFDFGPGDHLEAEAKRSLGQVESPLPSKEGNQP